MVWGVFNMAGMGLARLELITPRNILIPCMALVILPVVAIRKISSLWPLSLLGTILVVLGVVVVFGLELDGLVETHDRGPLLWMNWRELLVCLGQAVPAMMWEWVAHGSRVAASNTKLVAEIPFSEWLVSNGWIHPGRLASCLKGLA